MTREQVMLQIDGVESNIRQIKEMIHEKEVAKIRMIKMWDEELSQLQVFLDESERLLVTHLNNLN
ncbi:MAG: hypothetical protein PHG08_00850 [Bacilli bacterium]|nr:hypothetical protein [Bacilli bacterium]